MADIQGDENDNQLPGPGQSNAGNDRIWGWGGDDVISGGAGDDELFGGFGADTLYGGAGIDTISYSNGTLRVGVSINLTDMTASGGEANGDRIGNDIENVNGTDFSDRLIGSAASNVLFGGAGFGNDVLAGMDGNDRLESEWGNDRLYGGNGDDSLDGGGGSNQLYGEAGNDVLEALDGNDILDGGAGNDILRANLNSLTQDADQLRGGAGADRMDGGAGIDTAFYGEGTVGVTVDLSPMDGIGVGSGGNAEGDRLIKIENLSGSQGHDRLIGNSDANFLAGGAGNDVLSGVDGADKLDGGAGNDTLRGDFGTDTLLGGTGTDNLDGGLSNDSLFGGDGNDVLRGGAGADHLNGGLNVDTVTYSESNVGVTINLATGAGSGGNAQGDIYVGVENANGSTGADTIIGNAGGNALRGMAGADTLTGGAGADHFVFGATSESVGSGRDVITDFSHAQGDRINLALIDASTTAAGNQAFTFIGAQAFHGVAGELRAFVAGGITYVDGDVNGDKVIDLHIALTNNPALVIGDFVL